MARKASKNKVIHLTTLHRENSALNHADKAMIDNEHVDGDGCGRVYTVRLVGKRSIAHEKGHLRSCANGN